MSYFVSPHLISCCVLFTLDTHDLKHTALNVRFNLERKGCYCCCGCLKQETTYEPGLTNQQCAVFLMNLKKESAVINLVSRGAGRSEKGYPIVFTIVSNRASQSTLIIRVISPHIKMLLVLFTTGMSSHMCHSFK